jgi:hypothetical protein
MRISMLVLLLTAGCGADFSGLPDAGKPSKGDDPKPTPAPAPAPAPVPVDMGPDDTSCGGMQFALQQIPPNVMLVLDRSGSMNESIGGGSATTKWSDLKSAIQSLVTNYDSQIRLGASIFSSDGNCGAGNITPMAPNNGSTVMSQVNAGGPGGNTPTAATLDKVRTQGMLGDPTRDNVVVLATDGLPNCGDVDVAGKIDALYALNPPVKTYVIGVGDGTASDPMLLNAWADAGHTARMGATHYYQANSPTDLKSAFDAIVSGIVSCTFKMSQPAPDPSQLYVWSNGTPVSMDPANGFTYDDMAQSVTLHGTSCDALKANPNTKIQVVYGCPAPPPIN